MAMPLRTKALWGVVGAPLIIGQSFIFMQDTPIFFQNMKGLLGRDNAVFPGHLRERASEMEWGSRLPAQKVKLAYSADHQISYC